MNTIIDLKHTPIKGERIVLIRRPDGNFYHASFGGKYYEGFSGRPASIAILNERGEWTHTCTREGETIYENQTHNHNATDEK